MKIDVTAMPRKRFDRGHHERDFSRCAPFKSFKASAFQASESFA